MVGTMLRFVYLGRNVYDDLYFMLLFEIELD